MSLTIKERKTIEGNIATHIGMSKTGKINIDLIQRENIGYSEILIRKILDRYTREKILRQIDKYNYEVIG
jgi:hypothetical protein